MVEIEEITEPDIDGATLEGRMVEIHGLKGRPELNGRRGNALNLNRETGRMGVRVDGESVAVRLQNLRLAPESEAAAASTDTSSGFALCIEGAQYAELRSAIREAGLGGTVHAAAGPREGGREVQSATLGHILSVLDASGQQRGSTGDGGSGVAAQALQALASVAGDALGRGELQRAASAPAASEAMRAHKADASVQTAGLNLLGRLAAGKGARCQGHVLGGGGADAAVAAMRTHRSDGGVQRAACALLARLSADEEADGNSNGSGGGGGPDLLARLTPETVGQRAVLRAGGAPLLAVALKVHADDAQLQRSGCEALANLSAGGPAGRSAAHDAGGASAAVRALKTHCSGGSGAAAGAAADGATSDDGDGDGCGGAAGSSLDLARWAIFLLASLAGGDAESKAGVVEAGGAAALARVMLAMRAQTDVQRLSLGALAQVVMPLSRHLSCPPPSPPLPSSSLPRSRAPCTPTLPSLHRPRHPDTQSASPCAVGARER